MMVIAAIILLIIGPLIVFAINEKNVGKFAKSKNPDEPAAKVVRKVKIIGIIFTLMGLGCIYGVFF